MILLTLLLLSLTVAEPITTRLRWEDYGSAEHGNYSDIVGKIPTAFETAGEVACSSEKATDGEWLIDGKTPIKEGSCIAEEYHHTVKCTEASPVDSKCDQAWPKAVGCVANALVDTGIIDCPKGKQIFFKQPGGAQFQGGDGTVTCWQGVWNVTLVSRDSSTTSVDLYRCKGNMWSIVKKKPDNSPTEQYAGEVTCSSEKATDCEWLIDGKTPIEEASCITQGWIELILSIRDLLSQAARFIVAFMTGNTIIPSSRDGGVADHESQAIAYRLQYALTYKTVGKQRRGLKLSLYARVLRLLSYLGFAAMVTLSLLEKTVRTLVGTLCGVSVMILSATLTPAVNCRSIGGRSMLGFAVYLLILPGVECFATNRSSTVVGRADSEGTSSGGWSNEAVIALACSALAIGMMMGGVGVYFFKRYSTANERVCHPQQKEQGISDPHPASTNATPREFPLEGAIDDRTADAPVEQTTISSMTSRETTVAHDMDNSDPISSPACASLSASCTQLDTSPTQSIAATSMIEEVRGAVRDLQLCDEMVAGSLLNSRVEVNQADSILNDSMMPPPDANSTLKDGGIRGGLGSGGCDRTLIYNARTTGISPITRTESTLGEDMNAAARFTDSPTSLPFLPSPSIVEASAFVPRCEHVALASRTSRAEGLMERYLADLNTLLLWVITDKPTLAEVTAEVAALLKSYRSSAEATQSQRQTGGAVHAARQQSERQRKRVDVLRTPLETEAPETLPVTIFTPGDSAEAQTDRSSIHAQSDLGAITPSRVSPASLQQLLLTPAATPATPSPRCAAPSPMQHSFLLSSAGAPTSSCYAAPSPLQVPQPDFGTPSPRLAKTSVSPLSLEASATRQLSPIFHCEESTVTHQEGSDAPVESSDANNEGNLSGAPIVDQTTASPASPCAAPCASSTSTSSSPSTLGGTAAAQRIPPAASPEHQRSHQQPPMKGQREDTEPCYVQLAREGSVLGNHEKHNHKPLETNFNKTDARTFESGLADEPTATETKTDETGVLRADKSCVVGDGTANIVYARKVNGRLRMGIRRGTLLTSSTGFTFKSKQTFEVLYSWIMCGSRKGASITLTLDSGKTPNQLWAVCTLERDELDSAKALAVLIREKSGIEMVESD